MSRHHRIPLPFLRAIRHPVRWLLHGAAALASVGGLALLAARTAEDPPRLLTMIVFGGSLVALFTTSSLYHGLPWSERSLPLWQRLDHCMIYVLIAGTYTPIAFNVLPSPGRWLVLVVIWGLAVGGTVHKLGFERDVEGRMTPVLTGVMGWLAIFFMPALVQRLGWAAVGLVLGGGLAYTLGLIIFATERPRLVPGVFSSHELFHVLVVVGSTLHFLAVLLFVVPYAS